VLDILGLPADATATDIGSRAWRDPAYAQRSVVCSISDGVQTAALLLSPERGQV